MFIQVLLIIAVISVVWAFWSLKKESVKREVEEAKLALKKGRVVYQAVSKTKPSSSSS